MQDSAQHQMDNDSLEKQGGEIIHHENTPPLLSSVEEKKLMYVQPCCLTYTFAYITKSRKIDRRLLPILGCLYAVSLVDRGNMSFALVAGMMADLKLNVDNRYSILVMVFFAFYV
jgi:hypothetical protein